MSNTLQLFAITASVLSVDSNIGGYIDRNVKCNRNGYKRGHTCTLHGSSHVEKSNIVLVSNLCHKLRVGFNTFEKQNFLFAGVEV